MLLSPDIRELMTTEKGEEDKYNVKYEGDRRKSRIPKRSKGRKKKTKRRTRRTRMGDRDKENYDDNGGKVIGEAE